MSLGVTLTAEEQATVARLKRMFPQREGGEQGLVQRLVEAQRAQPPAGANADPQLVEEFTARLRRMFPQKAARSAAPSTAPPTRVTGTQAKLWNEDEYLSMCFPPTAPVIAITPLEDVERGQKSFRYVPNPDDPEGEPWVEINMTRAEWAEMYRLIEALGLNGVLELSGVGLNSSTPPNSNARAEE